MSRNKIFLTSLSAVLTIQLLSPSSLLAAEKKHEEKESLYQIIFGKKANKKHEQEKQIQETVEEEVVEADNPPVPEQEITIIANRPPDLSWMSTAPDTLAVPDASSLSRAQRLEQYLGQEQVLVDAKHYIVQSNGVRIEVDPKQPKAKGEKREIVWVYGNAPVEDNGYRLVQTPSVLPGTYDRMPCRNDQDAPGYNPGKLMVCGGLMHAQLSFQNLSSFDLRGASLIESKLACSSLVQSDLRLARLKSADLRGLNNQCDRNSNSITGPGPEKTEVNLGQADLSSAKMGNANLQGANLIAADMTSASLDQARFKDSDLSSANLEYAHGSSVNFSNANLSGARLENADLPGADLRGANLSGVNLSKVNLEGAKFDIHSTKIDNLCDLLLRNNVVAYDGEKRLESYTIEYNGRAVGNNICSIVETPTMPQSDQGAQSGQHLEVVEEASIAIDDSGLRQTVKSDEETDIWYGSGSKFYFKKTVSE